MSSWKKLIHKFALKTESNFDQLKIKLYERLGSDREILIIPYYSYTNNTHLHIKGRILRNKNIEVNDDDSVWDNLINSYKRMGSSEIPFAKVKVQYNELIWVLECDDEGYYQGKLPINQSTKAQVQISLVHPEYHPTPTVQSEVFTPNTKADFGIISDVDDTIMETSATSFRKMAVLTFLRNVHDRHAFPGITEFYQKLQIGPSGANNNPFYFVSSSPWNLYDLIADFIELHQIPKGPIFLRDIGLDEDKFIVNEHSDHKIDHITRLLKAYPSKKYILIGDSGQEDTFIYYQIATEYPERIIAIYIRDTQTQETLQPVKAQIAKARAEGIEMLLIKDSQAGIDHAVNMGLIKK